MKKNFFKIIFFTAVVGMPLMLGAQGQGDLKYTPLEPLPGVVQSGTANFGDLIEQFFKLLINVGAFVAVTMLVIAGITYMVSEKTFSKLVAREKIKAAFFGMAILAGAWLILNTVNPRLLEFKKELLPSSSELNGAQNTSEQNTNMTGTSGNIGKMTDDCEEGGGRLMFTTTGSTCRQ